MMNKKISAIILASGLSKRIKKHKAFLAHPENLAYSFIDFLISEYHKIHLANLVITLNQKNIEAFYQSTKVDLIDIKCLLIENPKLGRFHSIKSAMSEIKNDNYVFIQNCDNPFINTKLLKDMIFLSQNDSYVVPVYNNMNGHPVLISPEIIKKILKSDNNSNLREILSNYKQIKLKTTYPEILLNINTTTEYEFYINNYKSNY